MRSPGGAGQLTEGSAGMSDEGVRDRELELWNILLNHEGRRELAIDHWSGELTGHAMASARLGIITVGGAQRNAGLRRRRVQLCD